MSRQWLGALFVALVVLGLAARYFLGPDPYREALSDREAAARGLAEAVAAKLGGKRGLVMANPFVSKPGTEPRIVAMDEAGVRGVRAGAEGRLAVAEVVRPELLAAARENPRAVPIDTETTTPLSYLVALDAFDRAAKAHADCEVIFSLIGLPADLEQCEVWKKPGAPSFALLLPDLRIIGGPAEVVAAVKSGKLLAFVVRKPGGVSESEPLGKDWKAEFDRRFLLVTADNVDEVAARTPAVLQNP